MIAWRPYSTPPLLAEMRAEVPADRCAACDGPLYPTRGRRGRRRLICGHQECRRLYHRVYGMDRRRVRRELERELAELDALLTRIEEESPS